MGGRVCTKCQIEKPLTEFRKDSSRKLGHSYLCKPCNMGKDAIRYNSDIVGQRQRGLEFFYKNHDRQLELRKRRYYANPEGHKQKTKEWHQKNAASVFAYNAKRRALKLQASPQWLTAIQEAQIEEMYDVARAITVQTGIEHHVDHIHPLLGKNFRGLHVPWNLQVIPAFDNLSKRNKFPVEEQHFMWES
jgi:hypothetical protein